MRTVQEPTITQENVGTVHERTVENHPAYTCIRANRVSGAANLYGSDFNHHHYISVTISRSEKHRHLANDWYHDKDELITVNMSESQWAHFISSLNVGSGSPCTMSRLQGQPNYGIIPEIPKPKSLTDQFSKEIKKSLEDDIDALRKMAASLTGEKPMGKKEQAELAKKISHMAGSIAESVGFVADQFDEHVEKTVDNAKSEINAYALRQVVETGIKVLQTPTLMTLLENK